MRIRPLHLYQTAAMALLVLCLLAALLLCGCRTAGHQVTLDSCRDCAVYVQGATDATQGKATPVKALSDLSAAASQSGDAAAELTDASAQDATSTGSAPVPAPEAPATSQPANDIAPAGDQEVPPADTGGETTITGK